METPRVLFGMTFSAGATVMMPGCLPLRQAKPGEGERDVTSTPRRSWAGGLSWEHFERLLAYYALPPPRVVHSVFC